jgi:hypothetical protein
MPKHDTPDGDKASSNLIDFRDYLHKRVDLTAQDNSDPEVGKSDWEVYRQAEYADGKRPAFSRYDLLWVVIILAIGWIAWVALRR